MNSDKEYLPLYTLNQLADRVAMNIVYFDKYYDADNIWDRVIEQCQKVETEPRHISTVIVHEKKEQLLVIYDPRIRRYHFQLTYIYILLYYRHRDDRLYQVIVFPELIRNMGFFGDDKIVKEKINLEIDKIIEQDKLVEQSRPKVGIFGMHVTPSPVVPKQKNEEQAEPSQDEESSEAIDWHDKVRLDALLRLMENDGADLEKHGNKMKAARIMQSITGLPLQTCKNYCTNRDLNTTTHNEEILKMNTLLQALGMKIRL
jgi:hypothetical protein